MGRDGHAGPKQRREQFSEEQRRARLYACTLHVFDMSNVEIAPGKLPARLTCVMCTEWLPTIEAAQYVRGFAAAGGDPEIVIEGFGR